MKLYVDVDETLVFWPNPNLPNVGNYRVNDDLVSVLKEGIKSDDYDVTIWSAGGASWAEEINSTLFFGYNLPSSGKYQLYQHIPANSYAVDDRLIHDRFYLYKFEKVFLPAEFVDYAKDMEKYRSAMEKREILYTESSNRYYADGQLHTRKQDGIISYPEYNI